MNSLFNCFSCSYKWGKQIRESLSDVVSISFTIDKTSNNRNFVLSLSVKFCIAGLCAPDIIILDGFVAPIPFCNATGTLEWPQDLGELNMFIRHSKTEHILETKSEGMHSFSSTNTS